MRVTCPNCSAAYEVPEATIGAGRKLRCARCRHDWRVEPPTPPAAPAPTAAAPPMPPAPQPPAGPAQAPAEAPAASPDRPPGRPPRPPRHPQPIDPPLPRLGDAPPQGRTALILAWAASGLFMLGFVAALLLFRAELAEAWPPMARLYRALGLDAGA